MANQPTWVTSLGDNSVKIQYSAAAALLDIRDTIETWLLAHGWVLWDNAAGTNARAYRAANKPDGVAAASYKYMVLDFNTASHMFCKVYEAWDASTHAGTNLCYYSDTAGYAVHVDTTNSGIMYIAATAQWAYFQSSTVLEGVGSTTGNSGCGIFEIARDNPEDLVSAGYPCWGWGSLNRMIEERYYPFSPPRNRAGSTGISAASSLLTTILGGGGQTLTNTGPLAAIPTYANAWNAKNWAVTARWGNVAGTLPEMKGRIFGLKFITKNQGFFMDDININVDADKFYSPTGTLTGHWVFTETTQNGRMALPK